MRRINIFSASQYLGIYPFAGEFKIRLAIWSILFWTTASAAMLTSAIHFHMLFGHRYTAIEKGLGYLEVIRYLAIPWLHLFVGIVNRNQFAMIDQNLNSGTNGAFDLFFLVFPLPVIIVDKCLAAALDGYRNFNDMPYYYYDQSVYLVMVQFNTSLKIVASRIESLNCFNDVHEFEKLRRICRIVNKIYGPQLIALIVHLLMELMSHLHELIIMVFLTHCSINDSRVGRLTVCCISAFTCIMHLFVTADTCSRTVNVVSIYCDWFHMGDSQKNRNSHGMNSEKVNLFPKISKNSRSLVGS